MIITDLHACLLRLNRDWHIGAHQHVGMHEMIVVLEGRIRTEIAGRQLDGGVGSALLYPADTIHEEWARGDRPLTTVCIGWSGDRPQGDILVNDARGRLTELARWLAELAAEPSGPSRQIATGLMAALLHEFAQPARLANDDVVARVRTWATPRLAETISLDDLARSVGLSRFHFVRAFRSAAGTTPMRWLRHQRLQAARTLLLTTDQPLRSIAARVGFADEFQLSRVFRRDAGKAPSQLRKISG
ncbi:MAG: AraC family transcriptional regulator [Planctomycetota bacterium]